MNNKKTVAFITRHAVANYGSLLQTYAFQSILERLNYDVLLINYISKSELPCNILKTIIKDTNWNSNILKRIIYYFTQYPVKKHMFSKFQEYRRTYLTSASKLYTTSKELANEFPNADVYVTGSDQCWNFIHNNKIDSAYFLSFLPDEKKRISYAASFGSEEVLKENARQIKKYLSKYSTILVRENSAIDILNQVELLGSQVLDPTMLLTKNDWDLIATKITKKNYVLVYQLNYNKAFSDYAKRFAKMKKLPLLRISPSINYILCSGKLIYLPDPGEFLGYIKNASYFLTDSFHGTAFALLFHKKFVEILPPNYDSRNRSILSLFGLNDRILKSYDDFSIADKKIDYEKIDSYISAERDCSIKLLKDAIES